MASSCRSPPPLVVQEAIVLAAAGSQITPSSGPLAGSRQAAQLSLTPLGLCQMVARMERFEKPERSLHPLLLLQPQQHLPLHPLQPASCVDSLASCASGLAAAVEAAVRSLPDADVYDEDTQVCRLLCGWGWPHLQQHSLGRNGKPNTAAHTAWAAQGDMEFPLAWLASGGRELAVSLSCDKV